MNNTCGLCESDDCMHFVKADAKTNAQLNILYCSQCGLVQQRDVPSDTELKMYYSHNYRQDYKGAYSPKPKYVYRAGLAALNRIKFLESHISLSHQTLLDIGAGGGEFVYMANKRGLKARGIEPNIGYSEFSQKQYGVEVQTAMLSDLEDATADILTLFHVYEHMAKPRNVIRKLYASVKDNGYLFIEVPNILQADASPHNIYFKAHLFYYSRFTLNSSASQYFDLVKVEDSGNLKMLLRKKSTPSKSVTLPSVENIQFTKSRLEKKGWLEYLLIGGGVIKPFQRIEKMMFEALIRNTSPKQILDHLYNQRHDDSKIFSRRNKQRLAVWSGAGGIGGLCFEALC
jgi:2-polyprenyl-3-methyl-5-hydroxy-6-metoxy-1,4-benzoquinol methylase